MLLPPLNLADPDALSDAAPTQHVQWIRSAIDAPPWGEITRSANAYRFHFFELAWFEVPLAMLTSDSRAHPRVARLPGADDRTIEHLWSNQVLPYLWSAQGYAVLHVSAVAVSGVVVAFAGVSGSGKSTLAMAMLDAGAQLFSDDGLRVQRRAQGCWAWPGSRAVRLWQDSVIAMARSDLTAVTGVNYSNKAHFELHETRAVAAEPAPLKAVYLLDGCDDPQTSIAFEPVAASEAFRAFAKHSFVLDPDHTACAATHFETLADLSGSGMVKRLGYPKIFGALPAVVQAIHSDVMAIPTRQHA